MGPSGRSINVDFGGPVCHIAARVAKT